MMVVSLRERDVLVIKTALQSYIDTCKSVAPALIVDRELAIHYAEQAYQRIEEAQHD